MLVRLLSFTVAAATVVSAKLNDPQERKLVVSYDKCRAECDSLSSGSITCEVVGYTDATGFTPLGTATCTIADCTSPQVGFGGADCTTTFATSLCPSDIVVDSEITCSTTDADTFECTSNCSDPTTTCKTECTGDCPTKTCHVKASTDGGSTSTDVDTFTCSCIDCAEGESGTNISCTGVDFTAIRATCGDKIALPCAPTAKTADSFTCDTCECVGGKDCSSEGCCTLADGTGQTCVEKKKKGVISEVCNKNESGSGGDDCASCDGCDASVVARGCFKGKNACCS